MSRWIVPAALLLAASCADAPAPVRPVPMDAGAQPFEADGGMESGGGIAARINNEILTWKDVDDALRKIRRADITPGLRRAKLKDMAEERLFLQAARQFNVTVTEQELDDDVRRRIKEYASEEAFDEAIRVNGITRTEFREGRRKILLVHRLHGLLFQKSVLKDPDAKTPGLMLENASPEEIREYYLKNPQEHKAIEVVHALRICLQFGTESEAAEQKRRAEAVLRHLEEGAHFELVHHWFSDRSIPHDLNLDRKTAESKYPPDIVKVLFETLKPGEISPILRDKNSFNLWKLERHHQQKEEPFEEAQHKIRRRIEAENRDKNRRKVRDHLARSAYIWPEDLLKDE